MTPLAAEYEARLAGPWTDIKDQLPMLYERACRYPHVRILEFGVRTGESTAAFLAAAEFADGQVRSCDLDEPQVPAWWAETGRWEFTRGSSLEAQPGAGECDVLFIDTSHDYEDTLRELARWVPHVVPGGLVLCHDTRLADPPFVPRAVAAALDAYCNLTGMEWRELGGHYGLGEITIGKGDGNGLRPGGAERRGDPGPLRGAAGDRRAGRAGAERAGQRGGVRHVHGGAG